MNTSRASAHPLPGGPGLRCQCLLPLAIQFLAAFLMLCGPGLLEGAPATFDAGWTAAVTSALTEAGTNRQELVKALEQTSGEQREGMQFLLTNMPSRDLNTLS